MYNDVVTVFNFHEGTGKWYPTVFHHVNLVEGIGSSKTEGSGITNADNAELIIRVLPDRNANTIIYQPYIVVTNDGDAYVDNRGVKLSYQEPETDGEQWYVTPKAYSHLISPEGYFTFKPETDFFVVGNYASTEPIDDDDYDEGLYHAMNEAEDGVYMITSAVYYSLLPHFEIGGR